MKSLIKKLLRENLLSEKLTHVDDDVNFLYEKYFKNDIDKIIETGFITKNMFKKTETDTSILRSEESVKAHELNPCVIIINPGSNFYRPKDNVIGIGYSAPALEFIMDSGGGDIKKSLNLLDYTQMKTLKVEFTEERIKGSIHHELVHWIDDTMNNRHITARINKAMERNTRDLGGIPVDASKMEIQAQIHNIKQLHNKYKLIWDTLSFQDMLDLSPSLGSINNRFGGYGAPKGIKQKWYRELKLRMHREGLLGKNMVR